MSERPNDGAGSHRDRIALEVLLVLLRSLGERVVVRQAVDSLPALSVDIADALLVASLRSPPIPTALRARRASYERRLAAIDWSHAQVPAELQALLDERAIVDSDCAIWRRHARGGFQSW